MIRPPGFRGAAFGTAADGDPARGEAVRTHISRALGIPSEWATVRQVHGSRVVEARGPGPGGEGDALITRVRGLPVAVRTADCVPVVLEAPTGVAVVHAGWRGMAAGVVAAAVAAMGRAGCPPERAAIGPSIGPCCYEVGEEVAGRLAGFTTVTSWGSPAADLWAAASAQLAGIDHWRADACTRCIPGFFSYRRESSPQRQVTLAWM